MLVAFTMLYIAEDGQQKDTAAAIFFSWIRPAFKFLICAVNVLLFIFDKRMAEERGQRFIEAVKQSDFSVLGEI